MYPDGMRRIVIGRGAILLNALHLAALGNIYLRVRLRHIGDVVTLRYGGALVGLALNSYAGGKWADVLTPDNQRYRRGMS